MKLMVKKSIVWLLVASLSFFIFLPPGQNEKCLSILETSCHEAISCAKDITNSEIKISSRIYELLFGKEEKETKVLLIPGGGIFGTKIRQSYVSVQSPGDVHELKTGDKIKSINGHTVSSVSDIKNITERLNGDEVTLVCDRDNKEISVKIKPFSSRTCPRHFIIYP